MIGVAALPAHGSIPGKVGRTSGYQVPVAMQKINQGFSPFELPGFLDT
jgi:hypothetical protein